MWNFKATDLFYIFPLKIKCLGNILNVKKIKFEEDWSELRPTIIFLRQSYGKYFGQTRETQ